MKAIINADDLGISRAVNDSVFELMASGHVTSATLMANGSALEDALRRGREFPHCSFGVHLNASEFCPLTNDGGLKSILDTFGCFAGNRLREIRITAKLREALFREWSAQIEHIQAKGFRVSHFDSHHHMHTVPGVFTVLKMLQRKFAIRKVRITMNIYGSAAPAPLAKHLSKAAWNFALRNWFRTVTTDGFTSLEIFVKSAAELKHSFRSVELMVHPGDENFVKETTMLAGEWWRELPFKIERINYDEL